MNNKKGSSVLTVLAQCKYCTVPKRAEAQRRQHTSRGANQSRFEKLNVTHSPLFSPLCLRGTPQGKRAATPHRHAISLVRSGAATQEKWGQSVHCATVHLGMLFTYTPSPSLEGAAVRRCGGAAVRRPAGRPEAVRDRLGRPGLLAPSPSQMASTQRHLFTPLPPWLQPFRFGRCDTRGGRP